MTAGALVREARLRGGLTQTALATLAGCHQSSVARIETGSINPDLATLTRLCESAGFALRVELAPIDHAQVALIEDFARLTPAARLRAATRQARLAAKAARAR